MPAADVSGACFGHMVASMWDGSAVRQENKDRLERYVLTNTDTRRFGASGVYTEEGETAVDGILLRVPVQ